MNQIATSIVLLFFMTIANQASACTPSPCWIGTLDSYYENVIPWSAQNMRESLHETIDDHERFPYTSSEIDTWDVLEEANRIKSIMTVPFTEYYLTPCIPLRTRGVMAKASTEATIPIQNIIMNRSP